MTLRAYRDYILVAPGYRPPYRVLYGGPRVRPEYDFAQQPEVRGTPAEATLGPERANEAFEPLDTRTFAERHPVLIQAALGLAAAALLAGGFFALRRRAPD